MSTGGFIFKILDYVLVPGCIALLLFEPNFLNGYIDHLEAGQYLGPVNGLFSGKTIYKDFFILFGPFQLYIIAFLMALFGKTMAVMRVFFHVNYILSFLAIYFLARAICRRRFFVYLAVFMCILEVSHPFWASRMDYGRMGLGLFTIFLLICASRREDIKYLIAAGAVSSFALFYSIEVGVFTGICSLAFIVFSNLFQREESPSRAAKRIFSQAAWYNAGVLLVAAPFLFFLLSRGALFPYLKSAFYVMPKYWAKTWSHPFANLSVYGSYEGFRFFLGPKFKVFLPLLIYVAIFLFLLDIFRKKRWSKEWSAVLLLFLYGIVVYKAGLRAAEGPSFQTSFPPLIILICFFFEKIWGRGLAPERNSTPRKIAVVVFAAFLVYFVGSHKRFYNSFSEWLEYQMHKRDRIPMYINPLPINRMELVKTHIGRLSGMAIPKFQADKMEKVVRYLQENTPRNEEIFTFPEHGIYNFLADRSSSSRFHIAAFAWTTPEWRKELLEELKMKKPRIVLYGAQLSNMAMSIGRKKELFPRIIRFLADNYRIRSRFQDILILERKTP